MSDAERLVRDFCEAISTRDIGEISHFFSEDAVYHNIPLEPSRGRAAVLESISAQFTLFESIDFRIRNIAVAGAVVLTERVDVVRTEATEARVPVMGAFEVRNGAIVAWRDYFDVGQVAAMLAG